MHAFMPLAMTTTIPSRFVVAVYADSLEVDITRPWTLILHPSELPVRPGTPFNVFFPSELITVKATLGELIEAHPDTLRYMFRSTSPSLNVWVAMPRRIDDIPNGIVILVSPHYIREAVQHWIPVREHLMAIGARQGSDAKPW